MTLDDDPTAFGSEKIRGPEGSPAGLAASPAPPAARAKPARRIQVHGFRAPPSRRQPRTKYTDEEKAKIQQVRRQRACLRCKMLRIRCSMENPCQPCLSSAAKGSERKVLSFCYCVRTRYVDVNIFDGPAAELPGAGAKAALVGEVAARLRAPALPDPEGGAFGDLVIRWLTEPAFRLPGGGSVVAALCATDCLAQLGDVAGAGDGDDDLVADFRAFLLAASAAHAGWVRRGLGPPDFLQVSHACGSRIVRRLDRLLSPQHVGRCGEEAVRALLLLVLGLILGVGYSAHRPAPPPPPGGPSSSAFPPTDSGAAAALLLAPPLQHSPTLWLTMREHLCQMLAHHLIFLGSLVGIRLETGVERYIIEKAIRGWDKVGSNIWADSLVHFDDGESGIGCDARLGGSPVFAGTPREPPPPPPVVAVVCPDIARLPHPETLGENPDSYLSMTDDDIAPLAGGAAPYADIPMPQYPGSPPYALELPGGGTPLRQIKRRSVWVVRPFDAAPPQGMVNVHARFRVAEGQSIGLFA